MLRGMDLSSWQGMLSTALFLLMATLLGVGVRLIAMMTIQQRRERMNRQINERLRTLIAAYKVLGGSFTGDLTVDPTHLRDILRRAREADAADREAATGEGGLDPAPAAAPGADADGPTGSERARRIRDAVEAALADVLLLGTEAHVRLAQAVIAEMVAGRPADLSALVHALRDFIRDALDLDPIPSSITLPRQGPTRPANNGGGRGGRGEDGGREGNRGDGGRGAGGMGGTGGGGMGGGGGGMGVGLGMGGLGVGLGRSSTADADGDGTAIR